MENRARDCSCIATVRKKVSSKSSTRKEQGERRLTWNVSIFPEQLKLNICPEALVTRDLASSWSSSCEGEGAEERVSETKRRSGEKEGDGTNRKSLHLVGVHSEKEFSDVVETGEPHLTGVVENRDGEDVP